MPKPSVPRTADTEAFLANEPIVASSMNMVELILAKLLQAPGGLIPTELVLGHPLGSNIQHILWDLELE